MAFTFLNQNCGVRASCIKIWNATSNAAMGGTELPCKREIDNTYDPSAVLKILWQSS